MYGILVSNYSEQLVAVNDILGTQYIQPKQTWLVYTADHAVKNWTIAMISSIMAQTGFKEKRTRDLHSSDQNVLFVPRIKTKKCEGIFLWRHQNCGIISPVKLELQTVHSFRKKLKTFYFNQAFPT